ncbi:MAG: hypothetical protein ACD_34C00285G0001 [uncultured bacterium]|nr:MAG: hypothetical protein ACD_34C00285G0001 [uncultured bacterium]HCS38693.1 hypothetical protein [Anaerolineaceae bacterium]
MKNRVAILMVISIILIMALSACGVVKDVAAVNDLGKGLMTALRDGDTAGSWDMLTTAVQDEVGSTDAWADFVYPRNFSNWNFTNTQVENNSAQMDGEATLGEETYTVLLVFDKVDDEWKISGINFALK